MKTLIQALLRKLISESDYVTTSNPMSGTEPRKASYNDLERITYQVVNAQKEYGGIKYFQDAREGDGTYLAIINKNGKITIKTPNRYIDDKEVGGVSTTRVYDNIEVPIKAYSGSDDLLQKGRGEIGLPSRKPYTESGASDARIKAYVIFGDMIIDRVRSNIEGQYDTYGDTDNTFKGKTQQQINRKEFINQREKDRSERAANKGKISAFGSEDEKQAYLDKQAALRAKYEKMKKRR